MGNKFISQMIIAGVGGQGVLFVTNILAEAARMKEHQVIVSEIHGMAQRGGSVISHLKIGPFHSSLISSGFAQILFSLDKNETIRNLHFLKPGGFLIINAENCSFFSPKTLEILKSYDVKILTVDADKIANKIKFNKMVNIILLAAAAINNVLPFSEKEIRTSISNKINKKYKSLDVKIFREVSSYQYLDLTDYKCE